MRHSITAVAVLAILGGPAVAQDAPGFITDTVPEYSIDSYMGLLGALEGDSAAIDRKTMQLVQLGVAAQIPCAYCVYYHRRAAEAAGASDVEIKAAIAAAADTRMWSTILNGNAYDMQAFTSEVDQFFPTN